ncbi:MAG: 4'-phosphopantetheinyl transferase superfamily protein [Anaerolineales bacterium]|nr:4'-phosphopantetheinyl transferase superfamily protein [Anaerolineales bacterium]
METKYRLSTKGVVHIWHTSASFWKNKINELDSVLSQDEISRKQKLLSQNRQEDYIISRGILRSILAQYLEEPPEEVFLETDPNGKPFLPGSNIRFNLSHSEGLFLYGFVLDVPIGVDLQQVYPISSIRTIIKNNFSPHEQHILFGEKESRLQDLFFRIWTAKEAYLKGTGEGFQKPANSFSICNKTNGMIHFELRKDADTLNNDGWNIRELHLAKKYKAALAVRGQITQIHFHSFTPLDSCSRNYIQDHEGKN